MNKFEQVSRDGLQMSLAGGWGGSLDLCLGVRPGLGRVPWPHVGGGGCTVRSNASWVMVTWGHPLGQTDTHTCENITFLQLR